MIAAQAEQIALLRAGVDELRRLMGRNSTNSSLAPSRDSSRARKDRPTKKRSGRRQGGQPGHPGAVPAPLRLTARSSITPARSIARSSFRRWRSTIRSSVLTQPASDELRAAGARPRTLMLTGVEAPTPSELRVARLAARDTPIPRSPRSLYATRATVETHLHAVYRKLGLNSRDELADALAA